MLSIRGFVAAVMIFATTGCGIADAINPTPLTVARKLEGRWETTTPVRLFYQTNFCAGRQNVASALWNVTWLITAQSGYDNVIDIEMRYTRANSTPIASACGNGANGWVPLVSPTFLEATLSATEVTAYDRASGINVFGSYITGSMSLTWVHYECIIYCSGEVSGEREFILVKR